MEPTKQRGVITLLCLTVLQYGAVQAFAPSARVGKSMLQVQGDSSWMLRRRKRATFLYSTPESGAKERERTPSPFTPFWKTKESIDDSQQLQAQQMADLVQFQEKTTDAAADASNQIQPLVLGAAGLLLTAGVGLASSSGITITDGIASVQNLLAHPQETLQSVVDSVQAMGPMGPVYFGLIYLVAEILAVPATPLTLSAGYLFGLAQGTAVVLLAATIAASVAFLVGKTFLRTWVEGLLEENPKFAKIDRAVGKEGFKLLLLIRLSPIFPFALSNYLYGASSIDFASYFWGTLLGFAPGTIAYVYTGMVGKALTLGQGDQPWFVYAGGFTLLLGFLKLVTDVASEIVEAIDDEEEGDSLAAM